MTRQVNGKSAYGDEDVINMQLLAREDTRYIKNLIMKKWFIAVPVAVVT